MHAQLILHHGREDGLVYRLEHGDRCLVGRGESAEVRLSSHSISRAHAVFQFDKGALTVTDLGSRNGTMVGGARVPPHSPLPLEHGQLVSLGVYQVEADVLTDEARLGQSSKWRIQDMPATPPGYRLEALLGQGSHSRVWEVRGEADGQRYAIKILRYKTNAETRERFLREGELCESLRSPYLVQSYARGILGNRPYIVMELVQGVCAWHALRKGPLPVRVALQLGADLAEGLAVAHAAGVIHRDVKPGNVLITSRQRAKLTDFGIAKVAEKTALTETGVGLGSLPYLSPEQATQAKDAEESCDLYGLGATLYHMLGGRPPFQVPKASEGFAGIKRVMDEIQFEAPPPLDQLNPDCPAAAAALVQRLMAKAPHERGGDAREVGGELRRLREGLSRKSTNEPSASSELSPGLPPVPETDA